MITQHHLRSSITNIRSQFSAFVSKIDIRQNKEAKHEIRTIESSANRLTRIVDDFLNITSLKIGSKILNTSPCNIEPLIEDIFFI